MKRRTIRSVPIAIALCALLLLPACSSSESYEAAVMVEAQWLCDVQRQAFSELGDMSDEFDRRLSGLGITAEEYESVETELQDSAQLRSDVASEYEQYCVTTDD